jgi:hypothetical protein
MLFSDQFHATAALRLVKRALRPNEEKPLLAPLPFWTLWTNMKLLLLPRVELRDVQHISKITILFAHGEFIIHQDLII